MRLASCVYRRNYAIFSRIQYFYFHLFLFIPIWKLIPLFNIKTASLETVFIPYHYQLIYLYNNKFYKFVNYFKIAITTFTKLSLQAFPMRSNPTLITMWLQPIVCSFHLTLFFGLLTQGVETPCYKSWIATLSLAMTEKIKSLTLCATWRWRF